MAEDQLIKTHSTAMVNLLIPLFALSRLFRRLKTNKDLMYLFQLEVIVYILRKYKTTLLFDLESMVTC